MASINRTGHDHKKVNSSPTRFLIENLHNEQLVPVPKYPALQVHVVVSYDVDPLHAPNSVA